MSGPDGQADATTMARFQRQIVLPELGLAGQRKLASSSVLIVGVGGLGSWTAELLTRAGVGRLRLVDDDRVDLTNIQRQALFDETDARLGRPKVRAAAERLGQLNAEALVEPIDTRADSENIEALADGMDLLLDGTDNFTTRFLINDLAVKRRVPWVFAGVVATEAQVMTIVPGRTPCLRCLLESPPPSCKDPDCRSAGVLGPVVAAVAALQAIEALKVLAGKDERISPYLLKFDLWSNTLQRIHVGPEKVRPDCPCCQSGELEFLEP